MEEYQFDMESLSSPAPHMVRERSTSKRIMNSRRRSSDESDCGPTSPSDSDTSIESISSPSFSKRAGKYLLSKSINTKLGRKVVLDRLGNRAAGTMVRLVLRNIQNYFCAKEIVDIEKEFLKIVLKTQTLMMQGDLKFNDSLAVEQPAHEAVFQIYRAISPKEGPFKPLDGEQITKLHTSVREATSTWLGIISPHLPCGEPEEFTAFLNQVTSMKLLRFVFSSVESELVSSPTYRESVLKCFDSLLDDIQILIGFPDQFCSVLSIYYLGLTSS